jgi:hypothetical protein
MSRAAKQETTEMTTGLPATPRPFHQLTSTEQEEARRTLPAKLKYMREKDKELVRGRFKYYDCPGGEMKFVFRRYKGDKIDHYKLIDGQIYSLPLGVIKHLNKDCFYTIHAHATDKDGRPIQVIGKKVQRCEFVPMEFVDIEDLSPAGTELVTVQHLL